MVQIVIPDVKEDTVESFRLKAEIKGISLEQELRNLLEANETFTPEERVAWSRRLRAQFSEVQPSLTLDEIREGLM